MKYSKHLAYRYIILLLSQTDKGSKWKILQKMNVFIIIFPNRRKYHNISMVICKLFATNFLCVLGWHKIIWNCHSLLACNMFTFIEN